ncbi:MAG: transposase [Thermoleophilaceae bacterium]|nr:transposase [Thermoleophilaceae bacterium]
MGRLARGGGAAAEQQALLLFDGVAGQGEEIAALKQRLEKLERRLGQNSRNSSLPPSKDPPQAPKRPPRKKSPRKQGGQPGHEGRFRELIDDPDVTVEHRPEQCRKCGRELIGGERTVGSPARHQVIELPDSVVITTEHQLLKVACSGCATHTRAELPDDVEAGAFGPRLRATIVMLAVMLMSRRATLTLLGDMFGVQISLGSIEKILQDASGALAAPWEAIKQAVQGADVANADETSWRTGGQRLWLWAALSATAACYRIDQTRARSAARELLGDFAGLLISDRYSVYDYIDPERRGACHSHLARTFQAYAERPGAAGRHGAAIKAAIDDVIRADTQHEAAPTRSPGTPVPAATCTTACSTPSRPASAARPPTSPGSAAGSWTSGRRCGTSPNTPTRRPRTIAPSVPSDMPSCGERPATAPRPTPANASSNESSRSAKPAA